MQTEKVIADGMMFESVVIRYDGGIADRHEIDLLEFSKSMQGLAQLAGVAAHLLAHRQYVKISKNRQVQVIYRQTERGCVQFAIDIAPFATTLPLFSGVGAKLLDKFLSYIIAKLVRRKSEATQMEKEVVDLLKLSMILNAETAKQTEDHRHEEIMRLMSLTEELVRGERVAARNFCTPIGRSCETQTINPEGPGIQIGRRDKEVLEAGDDIDVSEAMMIHVKISELDMQTGGCRVEIENDKSRRVRGSIIDPKFKQQNNEYALAMARKMNIKVIGYQISQDGVLKKVLIEGLAD